MIRPLRAFAILLIGAVLAVCGASPAAAAEIEVDLALVLAVDASRSIDSYEYDLQRRGYLAALTDARVLDAIRSGPNGAIAITYLEWSGPGEQEVLVDWRVVRDAATASAFANDLRVSERRLYDGTSISGAIDAAAGMFGESGIAATRRAIDVSADGTNNRGRPAHLARDDAVKAGITINGLAIINERPSRFGRAEPPLEQYMKDNVIGGPGAFLLVVNDFESFGEAILKKLILEISGRTPEGGFAEGSGSGRQIR
jgi:hypothetical protein